MYPPPSSIPIGASPIATLDWIVPDEGSMLDTVPSSVSTIQMASGAVAMSAGPCRSDRSSALRRSDPGRSGGPHRRRRPKLSRPLTRRWPLEHPGARVRHDLVGRGIDLPHRGHEPVTHPHPPSPTAIDSGLPLPGGPSGIVSTTSPPTGSTLVTVTSSEFVTHT